MEIANKKVLITGSNRGIGYALSCEFAKGGAELFMAMRKPQPSFESEMKGLGARAVHIVQCDLSSFEAVESFANDAKDWKIDIMVNNAGLLSGGLLENEDMKDVYKMLQVNLFSVIHLTSRLLPGMISRKNGKIVNNASISGILNLPAASCYTASKTGLVGFTRSLEQELGGTGVTTLLLITPGVETRMFAGVRKIYSKNLKVSPKGGTISPEVWAKKVLEAIGDNKRELWPGGATGIVGRIYQIFPGVIRVGTRRIFKR